LINQNLFIDLDWDFTPGTLRWLCRWTYVCI